MSDRQISSPVLLNLFGVTLLVGVMSVVMVQSQWLVAQTTALPSLQPVIRVLESFVGKQQCDPEDPETCQYALWVTLGKGEDELVHEDDDAIVTLHQWSNAEQEYAFTGTLGTPLYTPDREIGAFSFPLNAPEADTYPVTTYFMLDFSDRYSGAFWTVKVTYEAEGQVPTTSVSKPNTLIKPLVAQVRSSSSSSAEASESSQSSREPHAQFPDVPIYSSLAEAAHSLFEQGIISGYPDGTFRPKQHVNRAEAAKFLLKARYGDTVPNHQNNGWFSDVYSDQWYIPYIMEAAALTVIKGYPDGTFRPGNPVNTAEFLKMMTLTFNLDEALPHTYIDVAVDDWFDPYAGTVPYYGLLPLRPDYVLWPSMLMTREEVAIAIYELQKRLGAVE